MNQNERKLSTYRVALYLIPVLVFIIMMFFLPGSDGSNLSSDGKSTYAYLIEKEVLTNWHSSLFMLEGILIKKIFLLYGVILNGWEVLKIMSISVIGVMLVSVAYLCHLISKNNIYCYGSFFFFFCVFYLHNGCCKLWGLDQYFVHLLFPIIASIVALHRASGRRKKIVLVVCCIFLLWHCCDYRKNFLLVMPIVLYAMLMAISNFRNMYLLRKIGSLCLVSVSFMLMLMPAVNLFFTVKRLHPLTPMLVSDIRIAYLLEDDLDSLYGKNIISKTTEGIDDVITSYWQGINNQGQYDELKELYIHEWTENPRRMVVSKLLQICQFYCGGIIPPPVQKIVENYYPLIKSNEKAWAAVFGVRVKEVCLRCITLFALFITALYSLNRYKRKKDVHYRFELAYIYIVLSVFVYSFSFIVVTPTPDYRYLMPAVFVGQMVLLYWGLHWLREKFFFRRVDKNNSLKIE